MSIKITSGSLSSNAIQKNLSVNEEAFNKSLQRLSSGNQIIGAADDAANLSISNKLEAQIRSMGRATQNAQMGLSMVQVAEGALQESGNILVRLRELGIQSSSDTVGDTERTFIQAEVDQLVQELGRISQNTKQNNINLLDGSGGEIVFRVGTSASESDQISFDTSKANASAEALGVSSIDMTSRDSALGSLEKLDSALDSINGLRASFGGFMNRLQTNIQSSQAITENWKQARSVLADTDIAQEVTKLTQSQILQSASVSLLAQANAQGNAALRLIG